jgi:hypothetical protein
MSGLDAYAFSDVEAGLLAVIYDQVRVECSTLIPLPRPAEFVQVVRVGGDDSVVSEDASVTVYAWADGWAAAYSLAALVRQRLQSVRRLGDLPVYRVTTIAAPSRAPDPLTGDARYQFTLAFKVRGSKPSI